MAVVTGCDARMFWQALILLESAGEGLPVLVCDYGLEPAQADWLRRRGRLLERVQDGWPAERQHVFYYKTALGRFLAPRGPFDWVAWLDADTLLAPGAAAALRDLADAMAASGDRVAACPDGIGTFGAFADQVSPRHVPADLFRPTFQAYGLDDGRAYLNVGMLLCRPDLLAEWEAVAEAIPPQLCLDQTAFNIAAHRAGGLRILPAVAWNCHGALLAQVTVADGTPMVNGQPVWLLHATSTEGHVVNRRITLRHGGMDIVAELKLFAEPALQALQLDLLQRAAASVFAVVDQMPRAFS